MQRPLQALTVSYSGLSRVLNSVVHVSDAFDPTTHSKPFSPQNCGAKEFNAIWDTGATNTVVNSIIVQECGLKPITVVNVQTANGERQSRVYLASIFLPNHVVFPQVRVTEGVISGAGVLIGMDIINRGDFAVTNKEGKTVFSFRMPSAECIDFVEQAKATNQSTDIFQNVGRNAFCPCGSGKKYKKCHGKK